MPGRNGEAADIRRSLWEFSPRKFSAPADELKISKKVVGIGYDKILDLRTTMPKRILVL
jgi:hypothetical protein